MDVSLLRTQPTSRLSAAFDGITRCTRYAFGPNRLHLCGPDQAAEIGAYMREGVTDKGLTCMLEQFRTLFPYLRTIAEANRIADPFDERVVEAYWVGNDLLEGISKQTFFRHLVERLRLRDRYGAKAFDDLAAKVGEGARMHHNFHVFNAYKRTGHDATLHTPETMDACRVSWGKVTAVDGRTVAMLRRPLVVVGHHIALGSEEPYSVQRALEDDGAFDDLRVGDFVTLHWHRPCEIVDERHVRALEAYTRHAMALANTTL